MLSADQQLGSGGLLGWVAPYGIDLQGRLQRGGVES